MAFDECRSVQWPRGVFHDSMLGTLLDTRYRRYGVVEVKKMRTATYKLMITGKMQR